MPRSRGHRQVAGHGVQAGAAIAWLPTLIAKGPQALQRGHLRHRRLEGPAPRLHLILLDTSGSMRQGGRLALAKGYAMRLVEQAKVAGDRIALLSFGGSGVALLLPPTPARAAASTRVRRLGGGGGTPLLACLREAGRLLHQAQRRDGSLSAENCWLWLLTDGRTLEQPAAPEAARHIVIVDFDPSPRAIGRCAAWARLWGAELRAAPSPT